MATTAASVQGLITQLSTDQGVPGMQRVQGQDGPRAAGSLCGTRFTHSEKRAGFVYRYAEYLKYGV